MTRRAAVYACAFSICIAAPADATMPVKTVSGIRGAEIWFVQDHTVPIVAMQASLPAGSVYDPRGKSGLADFAASMLDEGAANLDSRSFHDALADRAIQLSVAVDRDYLKITLVTESVNAKEAFHLLGLALQRPRFDADATTRVRAQLLQNIASENEEPESVATKGFYGAYFSGHPYARPPGGDPSGINAVTSNDLRAFARTHWVRSGLKVAVSGDVGPDVLAALLVSTFGPLPATGPGTPSLVRVGTSAQRFIKMDVPQPAIVFGLPGPLRSDPDFIAVLVANQIVGAGGFSSRLTDEVRVKRGLTYDISTDLLPYRSAGVLVGDVGTRRESVRQSVGVIRAVLSKFAASGATAQELADAKTYLTGSFPLSFSSEAGTVAQLNTFQCEGLGPDYLDHRDDLIESVTLDDIRRVAKRFFDPVRLTVVIAGTPAETALPGTHR